MGIVVSVSRVRMLTVREMRRQFVETRVRLLKMEAVTMVDQKQVTLHAREEQTAQIVENERLGQPA